jgi:hypothetical protein
MCSFADNYISSYISLHTRQSEKHFKKVVCNNNIYILSYITSYFPEKYSILIITITFAFCAAQPPFITAALLT